MPRFPIVNIAIVGLLLSCLCACQKSVEGEGTPLKFVEMPDSKVFIRVNGEDVTFGRLRKQIAFEEAVRRLSLEQASTSDIDGALKNFRIWRRTSLIPEFVNNVLVDQEAKKRGIKVDQKATEAKISKFLSIVKMGSEEEFLTRTKIKKEELRARMEKEAIRDRLIETLHSDIATITTNDMREVAERFAKFNESANATNALQRAKCEAIIAEINAGLPFDEAYKKYNQVESQPGKGCEWGDFFKIELKDNERLQGWAFSAPVGTVSGPFEWEDGICIVKIASRTKGTAEEYSVSASVASVHLQRITLLYCETLAVPKGEDLRKQISEARRKESFVELIKALHEKMQLEYPYGTVIDGAE